MPQHTSWRHWKPEDDARLAELAGTMNHYGIAEELDRTEMAVMQRASKLKISLCFSNPREYVTKDEVRLAKSYRKKYRFAAQAARAMGVSYARFRLLMSYAKR